MVFDNSEPLDVELDLDCLTVPASSPDRAVLLNDASSVFTPAIDSFAVIHETALHFSAQASLPRGSISRGSRKGKNISVGSGMVRRSLRLCESRDRLLSTGDGVSFPDSGASSSASGSGSGMGFLYGSTYSPCVLSGFPTSTLYSLARGSGFTFSDIQLDAEYIRSKELESVRSL